MASTRTGKGIFAANAESSGTFINQHGTDSSNFAGQVLRVSLYSSAILCALLGILIMFYTVFNLRPKLVSSVSQMEQSLSVANSAIEQASTVLDQNNGIFSAAGTSISKGGEILHRLPETLTALQGTLFEASHALEALGQTASQTTEGLGGLVVPREAIEVDTAFLGRTAIQLRLLGGMVGELQSSFAGLSTSTTDVSDRISKLKLMQDPFPQMLELARVNMHTAQKAISDMAIPLYATLLGVLFGCLWIVLGLFAATLALIHGYVSRLERFQRTRRDHNLPKAA